MHNVYKMTNYTTHMYILTVWLSSPVSGSPIEKAQQTAATSQYF